MTERLTQRAPKRHGEFVGENTPPDDGKAHKRGSKKKNYLPLTGPPLSQITSGSAEGFALALSNSQ